MKKKYGKNRKWSTWVKRYAAVILAFMTAVMLTSCGVALEDRTFPLSLGVDYKNNVYQVYYGIPDLSGVTGQNKDGDNQEAGEEADFYQGETMEEAENEFLCSQEDYLDMGHLKVILLGDGILKDDKALRNFLYYMENKPSIAGNIYVCSCEQLPEVMGMDGIKMDSLGDFLTGILENRPDSHKREQTDLQDLYNAWHNDEKMPELPVIRAEKDKLVLVGAKEE